MLIKFNDSRHHWCVRKRLARREFAVNLNALLSEKGLHRASNGELARQISRWCGRRISHQSVGSWRNGEVLPLRDRFELLADWLDCEPCDLLPSQYQNLLQKNGRSCDV